MGTDATPTLNNLPLRHADFGTLAEALDYAAQGETGCNFYDGRGRLYASLPYSQLRVQAQELARRLNSLRLNRGSRVALVADTNPDFMRLFFACQYAGLVPVPLPASVHLGGRSSYITQLRSLLQSCRARIAVAPGDLLAMLNEATAGLDLTMSGEPAQYDQLPRANEALSPLSRGELAYLQYTSGSTRFPRGVMITQEAVMSNLAMIVKHGLQVRPGDRCVSWLPYYHDMGLVGLGIGPIASQLSVDYLGTREFAMRPRLWLSLMSRHQATISFGPPFGYELCARRMLNSEADQLDLRAWRIAGVGAETIRPSTLSRFAEILAPAGFNPRAFLACYGMAECSLALSFASLDAGFSVDKVDAEQLSATGVARPLEESEGRTQRANRFVNCGVPLPEHQIEIRDEQGRALPERHCGLIFARGPSLMTGYFGDPVTTKEVLSADGWLNTGDMGYLANGEIFITGRQKDLIIINGRNIWPQDLEYLAEQQPAVRAEGSSAFAISGPDGEDIVVLVIQSRESDTVKRTELIERVKQLIRAELGISCFVDLVPPHTLPRTSSGKLSRSGARRAFIERMADYQWLSRATPFPRRTAC